MGEKEINYFVNTAGVKDKRFRPEAEITLFRIVQEAILNIARHANAKNVFLLFAVSNDVLTVEIEDDGDGFDMTPLLGHSFDMAARRGLGLLGMKERALLLGGVLEICSQPGIGTEIALQLPLSAAEVEHA